MSANLLKLPPQLPIVKVPVPPDTEISKEAMDAAKKWLFDVVPQGVATFAGFSKTGEKEAFIGRGCHASMTGVSKGCRYLFATSSYRGGKSEELVSPFVEWLVYHSPYSDIIVNKDDFQFILDNGFILNTDAPVEAFQNLLITTRHLYELPNHCFKSFNDLVLNKGVDGLIAYSVIFLSGISSSSSEYPSNVYTGCYSHRASTCYTPEHLLNIYHGRFITESKGTYKEIATLYGGSCLWKGNNLHHTSAAGLRLTDKEFDKCIRLARGEKDVEVYTPPNPFAKKTYGQDGLKNDKFTNEEAITVLIPYIQKKVKADGIVHV